MASKMTRREALTQMTVAGVSTLLGAKALVAGSARPSLPADAGISIQGQAAEIRLTAVSANTLRISVLPVSDDGAVQPVANTPVLVPQSWPAPLATIRSVTQSQIAAWGEHQITVSAEPLSIQVEGSGGKFIQKFLLDAGDGAISFSCGARPLFGLGEGGRQFDRRGGVYPMRHGERVRDLDVDGARLSIPWLISSEGWALFFNQPFGSFGLMGNNGEFRPWPSEKPLPLDIFLAVAQDPQGLFLEYARLTGFPHMPPIWALGYQQSHRTLASREEVLSEAKTFRDKHLPCDVLIYLGTGFCPSGWNTGHGSFTFNKNVFPDPKEMIDEFHQEDFRVALHVVKPPEHLHGRVGDTGAAAQEDDDAAHYWKEHLNVFDLGVDGWWADEGDPLDPIACLVRNRMYWEGPQIERPNVRPYTLNRNGYAGIQRYGWLWSGDIDCTWDAFKAQIAVGINTGLSGMPYWGTDTGGFVTTPELTGEMYVRWFQFSTFCPLFRSHGRTWKLRLPWGWDTGDYGPTEMERHRGKSPLPDPSELHNAKVEPICRKYLDLRYQMMPYLYTLVREAHDTGMPIMRALWLHYPDDPRSAVCADQYFWGRDILVAPVTEKGATLRRLYLPRGEWYDFWTEEKIEGGQEISRAVDLATMPLYVRAGSLLPTGPVKQHATEQSDSPLTFTIYPGADGEFVLYEDDGLTFNYRKGEFMRLRAQWQDGRQRLTLSLMEGSRLAGPAVRKFNVRIAGSQAQREIEFDGRRQTVHLRT